MARISILIAAYNAQGYINKCLQSLARQTFTDFEAICIDDASTDNTADEIYAFAARDSRFRLVRQKENGGQAKARNAGLRSCTGEIITFLDADDWYSDDALQRIIETYDNHPQTDCVLFRCVKVYPDGTMADYDGDKFNVLPGREACVRSFSWRIHGIYAARRSLFEQYPYDDSCRVYSDDNTTHIHYYLSREVRQCEGVYYYLQHPASATHKVSTDKMLWIAAADSMRRQLKELGCDGEMTGLWETERWKIVVDCYYFYHKNRGRMSREERAYCLRAIREGRATTVPARSLPVANEAYRRLTRRFGYIPFRRSWRLFRLEEEIYFALRRMIGRY